MAPLRRSLALVALLAVPALAAAQARGLPLINSGMRSGGTLAVDLGIGNDAAGTGTTAGITASTGAGFIGVSGAISRGPAGDNTVWAQAVAISFRLLGGTMTPFRLTLQAGAGHWSQGVMETVRLPIALGVAAEIPVPGLAIRTWLAPRIDYLSTSFENSDVSRTEAGLSGGIDIGFLNGMILRSAYDRLFSEGDPGILSLGVGMSFGR